MDIKAFINQRKTLLLILGLVFLIFLIFLGFYFYFGKILELMVPPKIETKRISPAEFLKEQKVKQPILIQFEECLDETKEPILDIKSDWRDEYYIIAKALMTKDRNICLAIENKDSKNRCLFEIEKTKFLMKPNKDICQKLTPPDPFCLAYANKDITKCGQLDTPLQQIVCQAMILGPEKCEKLSGTYDSQGVCKTVSGIEGIQETCGQISEAEAKSLCKNSAYFVEALRKKDRQICDLIDMKTSHFTVLFCRVLTSENPQKEWRKFYSEHACYEKFATMVAKIKNDPSLCEKIPFKDSHNRLEYKKCVEGFK